MHPFRATRSLSIFAVLFGALASTACGGENAADSQDQEGALETSPKLGQSTVSLPNGYLAVGIDVVGGKIWAGLNNDYGYAVSIDPSRMTVVDKYGPRDTPHLRASEAVTHDGREVVFLGYDNEGDRDNQFSYWMTWFNPATKKISKSIKVELDKTIVTPGNPFVDRPNVAFVIDGGKVHFSVAHKRVNKLVTFDVPSAAETVLNQDGKLFDRGVELPEFAKGLAIDGGAAYVGVPKNAQDGYVVKIDLSSGAQKKIGEKLGYPNAVRVAGSKLVVSDHNGRVLTLDKASGRVEKEDEMPDYIDDIAVSDGFVYAATRSAFVVTKLAR